MMFTFETTERWRDFIAGIHNYDRTARAQIVVERINPKFHALIRDFAASAGKTVVLNTSFNLHGYPIVMGAVDAMDVMQNSSLSYLVINDTLVTKAPLENREELRATPTPRGGTEDPAGT
jgi:carbamoyltransferase